MSDFEVAPVGTQEQLASHQKNNVDVKEPSLGALINRVDELEGDLRMSGLVQGMVFSLIDKTLDAVACCKMSDSSRDEIIFQVRDAMSGMFGVAEALSGNTELVGIIEKVKTDLKAAS